eukprot:scaffold4839_cov136-Isochrysis_galbana.AAC.9
MFTCMCVLIESTGKSATSTIPPEAAAAKALSVALPSNASVPAPRGEGGIAGDAGAASGWRAKLR